MSCSTVNPGIYTYRARPVGTYNVLGPYLVELLFFTFDTGVTDLCAFPVSRWCV